MLREILAAVALTLYTAYPVMSQDTAPDLILHHGKVVTADLNFSVAEAIAIRGERIVRVGSNSDVLAFQGPKTEVIDLAGKVVLPGLY